MARNGSRAEQQKVDPPPYVPGMDAAGVVDEVGDGVATGVRVGDAVMAMVVPTASHGAYREQIVLDARAVVPAPAGSHHRIWGIRWHGGSLARPPSLGNSGLERLRRGCYGSRLGALSQRTMRKDR